MRVASARHQAEAEMLEDLLLEQGIPSLMRRSGGFDVPDFLAERPARHPRAGVGARDGARGAGHARAGYRLGACWRARRAWVKALAVALAVGILALVAAGVFAAVF